MGLTRPRLGQFQTTTTAFDDEIIVLNNSASGTNTNDIGIIFERGDSANTALIWDESANTFSLISTTEQGSTKGNIAISSYSTLTVGNLVSNSLLYPISDGSSGQFITTDGSGNLSFSTVNSSFTLSADSGSNDAFTTGGTLTFTGGTGINTTVSNDTITVTVDSSIVTKTDTQTLTNKTLTAPTVTGNTVFDTNTLYVDATNNAVGVGTTTPNTYGKLTVLGGDIAVTARKAIKFYDTDTSNYVALRASSIVASNVTWTLPSADGTSGQSLITDGAGTMSWSSSSGGGSTGFSNSTITTCPGASGNYDLAEGTAQNGDEIPFETGGSDAFGVSLGVVYDSMEPTGSTTVIDYGDSESYVGA